MRDREIDLLLTGIQTTVPGRAAVYLSCSVTTGPLLIKLLESGASAEDPDWPLKHVAQVVRPNIERAKRKAAELRASIGNRVVINPAVVPAVAGWTQSEFKRLWDRVIRELVDEIVFLNGWEFSAGCCHEAELGFTMGLKLFDETMSPLDKSQARFLMLEAKRSRLLPREVRAIQDRLLCVLDELD